MKKGMYKFLVSLSCLTLCMSFFIVHVKAETDVFYPDPSSYSAYYYFFNSGYSTLMLSSSGTEKYYVSLDNVGTNNGTESGSEHTTGTINSNGSSTLGAKYMVCSTNNGTSASQTYSCYFSNKQSGVSNSQSINIGFNENTYTAVNNTITQSIDTDITGQITHSTSDSQYSRLPWLKGTHILNNAFNINKRFYVSESSSYYRETYFAFYTLDNIFRGSNDYAIYTNSSAQYTARFNYVTIGRLFLNILRVECTSGEGYLSVEFPHLGSGDVLPLYFGTRYGMPDNIAVTLNLQRSVGTILNEGNNSTSSSVSDANNANTQVSQKIGQFDTLENNSVIDMNSNISNLNLTSDILSNSKFLSSAQWVKIQFDRMTVNTPIGSVLSFSLILGITLIFLGKIR